MEQHELHISAQKHTAQHSIVKKESNPLPRWRRLANLEPLAYVSVYLSDELQWHDADHACRRQHRSDGSVQLVALRFQDREVVPL